MSFNHEEANLNVYGGILRVNKYGLQDDRWAESEIRRKLIGQLASKLACDAIQKTEDRYSTEFRLHVYVLTPTQLERLVQQRAERMYPNSPNWQWEQP